MSSGLYSQKPQLAMPREVAARVCPADLGLFRLNDIGDNAVKQFEKTAKAVERDPWHSFAAATYLRKLIARRDFALSESLPPGSQLLTFKTIFEHRIARDFDPGPLTVAPLDQEGRDLRQVRVVKAKPRLVKKQHLKRPASKAKAKAKVVPQASGLVENVFSTVASMLVADFKFIINLKMQIQ